MTWSPPLGTDLHGPEPLGRTSAPRDRGIYVVASAGLVSAIGSTGATSGLRGRLTTLANLGTHRASRRVLCAAFCTQAAPMVWWRVTQTPSGDEEALKHSLGRPEIVASGCHSAAPLRQALVRAAGEGTWEAGYIDAVLDIGEHLALLFAPRFTQIWKRVGVPPGPWVR